MKIAEVRGHEGLSNNYVVTWWDTSAINGRFLPQKDMSLTKAEIAFYQATKVKEFNQGLKSHLGFCVPQEIFNELAPSSTNHKKLLKNGSRLGRGYFGFVRALKEKKYALRELRVNLQGLERVFSPNSIEEKTFLDSKRDLYMDWKIELGLSGEDYELFLHGLLSFERGGAPTAIVSNDTGIAKLWKRVTRERNFNWDAFNFFIRAEDERYVSYPVWARKAFQRLHSTSLRTA